MAKKIIVTQTRSAIRSNARAARVLHSLGLGRIGRSREHLATPATLGSIKKVAHLVSVRQTEQQA